MMTAMRSVLATLSVLELARDTTSWRRGRSRAPQPVEGPYLALSVWCPFTKQLGRSISVGCAGLSVPLLFVQRVGDGVLDPDGRQLATPGRGILRSMSRHFALLQRRAGGRRASHPSPPPSWHQSTHLPASKRVLRALQRRSTTLNGQDARLGSA